jgi:hypothetical protein
LLRSRRAVEFLSVFQFHLVLIRFLLHLLIRLPRLLQIFVLYPFTLPSVTTSAPPVTAEPDSDRTGAATESGYVRWANTAVPPREQTPCRYMPAVRVVAAAFMQELLPCLVLQSRFDPLHAGSAVRLQIFRPSTRTDTFCSNNICSLLGHSRQGQ